MNTEQHIIVGIHITDRTHHAAEAQAVFTRYGHIIKTRLGLHDAGEKHGSPNGLVILELIKNDAHVERMISELRAIHGIEVQTMIFAHA